GWASSPSVERSRGCETEPVASTLCDLSQRREEASRCQRDVALQRRIKLERLRLPGEIPEPQEAPVGAPLLRHGELVAGDVEGRSLPAIGRLHLDQAFPPVGQE